ncbi:DUF3298 and DUF4163 domain-containing protein [Clostridium weizhouense]|uniref:DUF3298 and DUF4163 domain-containing protein n=1 Tax=Clostridium weizhouense TaxID=2859781 RepID=A0ABS7AQY4_9CLOT|nr:DUF3298 and DUF4163 domain-containing protein [Clostridium weizhouense]MBW6410473.1 DUF3298 and DUF4163 domain-containing protein [Clostridium weizhouense]
MSLFSNIIITLSLPLILSEIYPQHMLTSFELNKGNIVEVVEKSIGKNFSYLKEDITILELKDGKDSNKVNLINKKISDDIIPKVQEAEKTSKEYFENIEGVQPTFPYEIVSKPIITKNNDNILSFYNDYYEFLGGAHGMTTRTSYTIDKNKEILLNLKDIFILNYNYKEIINKEITKQIKSEPDKYFDSGSEFKGIEENQNFYIKGKDLIIYYQLYDIAPYVAGIPEFKVPLSLFDKNFIYYDKISD